MEWGRCEHTLSIVLTSGVTFPSHGGGSVGPSPTPPSTCEMLYCTTVCFVFATAKLTVTPRSIYLQVTYTTIVKIQRDGVGIGPSLVGI